MSPKQQFFSAGGPAITRRAMIGGLALIGLTGQGENPTLADIGQSVGIAFGAAMRAASLAEPQVAALMRRECAVITPELEMKWAALEPSPGGFDASGADALAGFARTNGQRLRGHALLWHRSIPGWFDGSAGWAPVGAHIARTVARWRDIAPDWDVVNEPIAPDGSGLRASSFLTAFGPDYIERALQAAREAAPSARLFINEYDLEYTEHTPRRATLLTLVRRLKREGTPLDGVGVQGHLSIARGAVDAAGLSDLLRALADLGLVVAVTELDVKERDLTASPAERDARVADHTARFLEVALGNPVVRSVACWGLSDRQSWLKVTAEDRARFPGAWTDGSTPGLNRGLPFDSSCRPKPMRDAVARALARR